MILILQRHTSTPPTRSLGNGAQLFLWCVRRWVDCRLRARNPVHVVRPGLMQARMGTATDLLTGFMETVSDHAIRRIEIRSGGATELSADEFLICRALSTVAGNPEFSGATLNALIDHAGVARCLPLLERLEAEFSASGFDLSIAGKRLSTGRSVNTSRPDAMVCPRLVS